MRIRGRVIIGILIAITVLAIGLVIFDDNDVANDIPTNQTEIQDEMPASELSDLSSDEEVFDSMDQAVEVLP